MCRKYLASKYVLLTSDEEPKIYVETKSHKDDNKWREAMRSEMDLLLKNGTFELMKLPKGIKALKNKWVYKLRGDENNKLSK